MIVFILTNYDELRIIKAKTKEEGLSKLSYNFLGEKYGTISEDLFPQIADDFVVCVQLTDKTQTQLHRPCRKKR